jgi:hypothetical protein
MDPSRRFSMPRIPGSFAALTLAAFVAGAGCGGGQKAQQASQEAAPAAPAGKAGHVTVSYYYLPG